MLVVILGYAAMVMLGLLPLAAVARLTGVEAQRAFFLPTEIALVVAFVTGVGVCLAVGRGLGLLELRGLTAYEEHVERFGETVSARRRRQRRRDADSCSRNRTRTRSAR